MCTHYRQAILDTMAKDRAQEQTWSAQQESNL